MSRLFPFKTPKDFPYSNGVIPAEEFITRPNRWLRTWIFFRKLFRRSRPVRESDAIKAVRLEAAVYRRDAAKKYSALEELLKRREDFIKELEGRLQSKERTIAYLENSDIPKLKDRIEVLEYELSLWVAVHERNLTREKAEIAMNNERIVPRDDAAAWARRMENM
jgi:hypothetical protein